MRACVHVNANKNDSIYAEAIQIRGINQPHVFASVAFFVGTGKKSVMNDDDIDFSCHQFNFTVEPIGYENPIARNENIQQEIINNSF